MSLDRAYDINHIKAVIKRGSEYLFAFNNGVASWTEDIENAWECDLCSNIAYRIARQTGGAVVSRNAEDSSLKKTTADSRERPATI